MSDETKPSADRLSEWFVPRFGSRRFRTAFGLLFPPYTGMVLAYAVFGSMLAPEVHWDRVGAVVLIYFLGLGVAAHALDGIGGGGAAPWGDAFSRKGLWVAVVVSLTAAYGIAAYYMIQYVPYLLVIALLEGFFAFAYNLEWFAGRFHTDGWFAFSWGFLPVTAGYLIQTNGLSLSALVVGGAASLFSLVEINASRPYKALKRRRNGLGEEERRRMDRYERILKSVSMGVCLMGAALLWWRWWGG
ncbi:MAG: hypothetical protein ACOWYE_03240 [Desulfatiglandales bacterium]